MYNKGITNYGDNDMTNLEIIERDEDGIQLSIITNNDGTFTAVTRAHSRDFKTINGARKWIAKYL